MSKFMLWFAGLAGLCTGVVLFEIVYRLVSKEHFLSESLLDLFRATMFLLWIFAGLCAAVTEVLDYIDRTYVDWMETAREAREKKKKAEVTAMMKDLGWNFPGSSPVDNSNTDGPATIPFQGDGRVIPMRNRPASDAR
ncbi:hypothetical protein [Amycolatopsis sp. NPDC059657]|uniref:hypothetical protein n=1 Tax=Amycolatopsis sp. NPDC059657 TaxID=3346899 RepID=UPI00366A6059